MKFSLVNSDDVEILFVEFSNRLLISFTQKNKLGNISLVKPPLQTTSTTPTDCTSSSIDCTLNADNSELKSNKLNVDLPVSANRLLGCCDDVSNVLQSSMSSLVYSHLLSINPKEQREIVLSVCLTPEYLNLHKLINLVQLLQYPTTTTSTSTANTESEAIR
jgi:hypothetical protein